MRKFGKIMFYIMTLFVSLPLGILTITWLLEQGTVGIMITIFVVPTVIITIVGAFNQLCDLISES